MSKKRCLMEMEFETEASEPAFLSAIVMTYNDKKQQKRERGPDELRNRNSWTNGYQNWDKASFKKRSRVSRDTFEYILSV